MPRLRHSIRKPAMFPIRIIAAFLISWQLQKHQEFSIIVTLLLIANVLALITILSSSVDVATVGTTGYADPRSKYCNALIQAAILGKIFDPICEAAAKEGRFFEWASFHVANTWMLTFMIQESHFYRIPSMFTLFECLIHLWSCIEWGMSYSA